MLGFSYRCGATLLLLMLTVDCPLAQGGGPVGTPPIINVQPKPVRAVVGTDVRFTVLVSSDTPVTYQWQYNGFNLVGEVGWALDIPAVEMSDGGRYRVVVRNSAGALLSLEVLLTPLPDTFLVPYGSVWRYLDNGTDQGTGWRGAGFDDGSWAFGGGELGYGDGDECSVVGYGPSASNKYITTYFRHGFFVADVACVTNIEIRLRRDDGAVVYLNGEQIHSGNMPPPPVGFQTRAITAVGGSAEEAEDVFELGGGLLVEGFNMLAVEIHQANPTSSDLSFDLEMRVDRRPPAGALDLSFDPGSGPNGPVCDLLMQPLGGIVITGRFQSAGSLPRAGVARLHYDGSVDPGFAANVVPDGWVLAVEEGPEEQILLGGEFQSISGQAAHGLALLDPETGEMIWGNTQVLGTVRAIDVIGTTIYVAGEFLAGDGTPLGSVALFDRHTRTLDIWATQLDGEVDGLWATRTGVYLSGDFSMVDGEVRAGFAALDPLTREVTPLMLVLDGEVRAFAGDADVRYIGGDFTVIGGIPREGVAALGGAGMGQPTLWDVGLDGEVRAAALGPGVLYLGGEFSSPGGSTNLSAIRLQNPPVDEFDQETRANGPILALHVQPDGNLLIAGDFTRVNGMDRAHIARIHAKSFVKPTTLDPPLLQVRNRAVDAFRVRVRHWPWSVLSLQRSGNFVDWEEVWVGAPPTGIAEYIDPGDGSVPARYYRAITED